MEKYEYDQGGRTAEEDVPSVVAHVVWGEDTAGHCTFDTFPRDLSNFSIQSILLNICRTDRRLVP